MSLEEREIIAYNAIVKEVLDTSNVLTLDNTTEFTPDADYEPATKKYVDDTVVGGTIPGLTASVAELNILDGATLSTAELNILDGVTSSTAEINLLTGKTSVQETLVSGTTIKTINSQSLLGAGDIVISGGGATDAADVSFTPTGTIAATDVQNAIAEVANERVSYSGATANLNLGNYTLKTVEVIATGSAGLLLKNSAGTTVAIVGDLDATDFKIVNTLTMTAGTASTILSLNASKQVVSLSTATYPTLTELSYVKGLTSSAQTQIDGKKTNSMTTNKLLGRGTAGTGAIEEITLGTNLTLDGTTLNAGSGGSVNWGGIGGTLSSQTDLQTALDGKINANAPITAGTHTKITYDINGLVTGGADATTADIADSTNKRYVTDTDLTKLSNTSGTNTGDQTSIVGITGTKAEFDTALTDGTFAYASDLTSKLDTSLTNTYIYVGNASNIATGVAVTGAVTISNTGVTSITDNAVTLGKIETISSAHLLGRHAGGAGNVQQVGLTGGLGISGSNLTIDSIALDKLDIDGGTDIGAALADADLLIIDDGATGTNRKSALSRVWAYISSKITGAISGLLTTDLTASRVLGSDGSGKISALDTATYPSLTELSYSKGVTSAIQTQIDAKQAKLITIRSVSTAQTLALTDLGTLIELTGTTARVFTVPLEATVSLPIGFNVAFTQSGTGALSIAAEGGVTIQSPNGLICYAQYASGSLTKIATNTWVLAGNMKVS